MGCNNLSKTFFFVLGLAEKRKIYDSRQLEEEEEEEEGYGYEQNQRPYAARNSGFPRRFNQDQMFATFSVKRKFD